VNAQTKAKVRPLVLPAVHGLQWIWDDVRAKVRIYTNKLRERFLDARHTRQALSHGVPIVRDIHGIRFVLYPWDRPSIGKLVRRVSDVSEFKAITKLVGAGSVAMDIGANVGIYSVLLSRLCGPEGRIWAFEPVSDTYWRLVETLALNRCGNVTPVQAAVCERDSTVRINLFECEFAEWNTLGLPSMPLKNGKRISPSSFSEVPGRTLGRFCDEAGIERINFLKVDVEGFEWAVFRGAEDLLSSGRIDHICFEISQDPLKGAGVDSRKVFQELEAHGYMVYRFDEGRNAFEGPLRDTTDYWSNFFASRMDLSRFALGVTASESTTKHD
jgi:FkbM family methyltransferase